VEQYSGPAMSQRDGQLSADSVKEFLRWVGTKEETRVMVERDGHSSLTMLVRAAETLEQTWQLPLDHAVEPLLWPSELFCQGQT